MSPLPPLTRALIVALATFSIINAAVRYSLWAPQHAAPWSDRLYHVPYLTIVPASSLLYPWVFLTATLVEQNIVGLLVTAVTLFYGGRYLERAWGSREYTKFILLAALLPNASAFVAYLLLYTVTRDPALRCPAPSRIAPPSLLTHSSATSINGGIAIQAGFLVAFKQLVPEHTVTIAKGLVQIRVKHFPAVFLLANTISGILLGTDTAMILSWIGFLTSWTYLRFYRLSPSLSATTGEGSSIRGDASDTFAFAYFFPDVVHVPVALAADRVYDLLVVLRLCSAFTDEDVQEGNEQASARGQGTLPRLLNAPRGSKAEGRREEAERRRALALRALDERLQSAPPRPPVSPSPAASQPEASVTGIDAANLDTSDDAKD